MRVHAACMRTHTRSMCTHIDGLRMHALCLRMHIHSPFVCVRILFPRNSNSLMFVIPLSYLHV